MSGTLGQVVFAFFEDHLKIQKGLRPGSIRSYRDTLKLFLVHVATLCRRPVTRLALSDLAFDRVLDFLRTIEEKLEARVHDDDMTASADWRWRLGQALEQVSLPVRSVLARPEISVAELLALKPGDVIPITLPPRTPLLAGARRIADGVIGEQDGRAALMIEKVGNA